VFRTRSPMVKGPFTRDDSPPMSAPTPETAAPVLPTTTAREHPVIFALALGAWTLFVGGTVQTFAWESRFFRNNLVHVGAIAGLVFLCARSLVDDVARRLLGLRGPVVAWRALAAGAITLALYDLYAFEYGLNLSWSFFTYLGRFWELEPEAFAVPLVTTVTAFALARRPVVTRARLRFEAPAAIALALALLVGGTSRAARRPEIHRYLDSLTHLGTIAPLPERRPQDTAHLDDASFEYADHRFGELTARRFVFPHRGQCAITVARDASMLPASRNPNDEGIGDCGARELRLDTERGTVVVLHETAWGHSLVEGFTRADLASGLGAHARMSDHHDAFSVPRAWLWTSAAMVAFAVAMLIRSVRSRRGLVGAASWRQATLRSDGIIECEGAQITAPYGTLLTPGPVVLRAASLAQSIAPFRGGGVTLERDEVLQGTLADVAAAREVEVESALACSVTASLISVAPLMAAAVERILV
jgi:hypothetical protein